MDITHVIHYWLIICTSLRNSVPINDCQLCQSFSTYINLIILYAVIQLAEDSVHPTETEQSGTCVASTYT